MGDKKKARLSVDQMLRDADGAWTIFTDDMRTQHTILLGDMACHVRALAAAVEELTAAAVAMHEQMAEMADAARWARRDATRVIELYEAGDMPVGGKTFRSVS